MTNPMTVTALQTAKREIRKRVRRQVMLRRLRRELANGEESVEVLRRPTNR
ncbi:MAG TPA: hypothetical protein VN738_01395 [Acidothermaceae bacterium]|nr:hypothetical protein [Acidothermaceae bacterium]